MNAEPQITERQREVLTLVQQGMGAREVGEKLGVTRNAVYQQIGKLQKMGLLDKPQDKRFGRTSPPEQATFLDATEQYVQELRARLTMIEEEERTARDTLERCETERTQISDVLNRLEGVAQTA